MKKALAIFSAVSAVATGLPAHATTIDFNEYNSAVIAPSVTSQGYTFTAGSGNFAIKPAGYACSGTCAGNGTANLVFGAPSGTLPASVGPLTLTGLTPFVLNSFDFAEFAASTPSLNATQLRVTGWLFGGGTVNSIFNLDGIIDGDGGVNDFQTATSASLFGTSLLNSVSFRGVNAQLQDRGFALDNIVVTPATSGAVPEPATWAMMLAGFGAIGFAMRRQRQTVRFSFA